MSAKVYIPQPIPEVALESLKKSAEVEMFPQSPWIMFSEKMKI
jgi:hypothetical protein